MAWQQQWQKHPAVRSGDQLSLGERAADRMRNGMGSWPFVFTFFGIMIAWAVINGILHLWRLGVRSLPVHPAQPLPVDAGRRPGGGPADRCQTL
jgi:hypothetical protein